MHEALLSIASPFSLSDSLVICLRLLAAWMFGYGIGSLYRWVRIERTANTTFPATLVLLSILIALVTQVIGDNLARAFGLVGALSIVRFRTVVEDTYDIAFVIYAVVIGMASGASPIWFAAIGFVIAGIAILALNAITVSGPSTATSPSAQLKLRISVAQTQEIFQAAFAEYFTAIELRAVETGRGGTAVDLMYQVNPKPNLDPLEMVQALQRLSGVQSVEFKV